MGKRLSALPKNEIKKAMKAIVGEVNVRESKEDLELYGCDHVKGFTPQPLLIVLPGSREEVSKILAFCNRNCIAVVPSGGRTGLAGGAVALHDEVVISLDRMVGIQRFDLVGATITVLAGTVTETVKDTAEKAGLFFPIDTASKGSAQIGGNLSTNVGGMKLIRFGGMREQVLGVEVVLADGQVLQLNRRLRKDNSGYDLKQLFIGAEGTLGIVTSVTLKLMPKPKPFQLVCLAVSELKKILSILQLSNRNCMQPTAIEFFSHKALDMVYRNFPELKHPFKEKSDFYVLYETEEEPQGSGDVLGSFLETLLEQGLITDAVIASTSVEFKELWSLRENISESITLSGHVRKNDLSLPIDRLEEFVSDLNRIIERNAGNVEIILFGHVGDGNIHINYSAPNTMSKNEFLARVDMLEGEIFSLLPRLGGSISAEHGIGLVKKKYLSLTRSDLEIGLMRQIKKILDPNGIMNPGKIFD